MRPTFWLGKFQRTNAVAVVGLFLVSLGFLPLLQPQPAQAATGTNQQINFQGKVVNPDGTNIPNGTYNIEFKIYQDGDGVLGGGDETLKWTESRLRNNSQGVTITDGIFQVNLGSVNSTLGSAVDFNQDTLWLSINLGNTNATCTPFSSCSPDGQMDPFIRFTSAPYALNSGKLNGLTSSQFVQLAQGVQADSSTASSVFINKSGASGNILELQKAATDVFVVGNSGTTAINTNSTSALTVQNGSNNAFKVDTTDIRVGIGVSGTPTTALSIAGTGLANGITLGDGASNSVNLYRNANDELKTDDALTVTGLLSGGNASFNGEVFGQFAKVGAAGTDIALRAYVAGDTQNRLTVQADGKILLGPGGSTAPDTNLYRSTTDTLKTDDNLIVGTIGTGGTNLLCYDGTNKLTTCSGAPGAGSYIYNGTALQTNANFNLQSVAAQSGTGTISSSGLTVSGVGTSFTTQLNIGDFIIASGQSRRITAIASNISLTTVSSFSPGISAGTSFTHEHPIGRFMAASSQVADVLQVQTSAGGSLVRVDSGGRIYSAAEVEAFDGTAILGNNKLQINAGSFELKAGGSGGQGIVQAQGNFATTLIVKGGFGGFQSTTDLMQFQNDTGTVLSQFTSTGALQGGSVAGTNVAGTNLVLNGGQGTGNVAGGNILFQYAPAGSSGATVNSLVTACTISGTNGSLSCLGAGATSERFGASSTAAGANGVSFGNGASAAGSGTIAIGKNATAGSGGSNSIAIGNGATADNNSVIIGPIASSGAQNNVIIGVGGATNGANNTAVGSGAVGGTDSNVAIGTNATTASSTGSIAIGVGATTGGNNRLVIGSGASNASIQNAYIGNGVTNGSPLGFTLQGTGSSTAGTAGASITVTAGAGATTSTGSVGGTLNLQGGASGGSGNNQGGTVAIIGGVSTGTSTGSSVTITGGTAIGTNQIGGTVTIQGGAPTGSGASGVVIIKSNTNNSTTAFQVQNSAGSNVLVADTVNSRIGVGTTPSAKLDVSNTGTSPYTTTGLQLASTFSSNGGVTSSNQKIITTNAATSTGATTRGLDISQIDVGTQSNTNIGIYVDAGAGTPTTNSNDVQIAAILGGQVRINALSVRTGLGYTPDLDVTGNINASTALYVGDTQVCTSSGCTTSGSFVHLQGSSPGTQDSGNLNISGTGIFATAVKAPIYDTDGSVQLDIGTGNASSIVLGKASSPGNLTLQGSASTTWKANNGTNTTTVGFGNPTANVIYNFQTAAAGTYSICTAAAVCSGYQASGSYVNLQGSTPGTAQVGSINVDNTIIAGVKVTSATLNGTTAIQHNSVDIITGANHDIGNIGNITGTGAVQISSTGGANALTLSSGSGTIQAGSNNFTTTGTVNANRFVASSNVALDTASSSDGYITKKMTNGSSAVATNDLVTLVNQSGVKVATTTTARDPKVYGVVKTGVGSGAAVEVVISGNYTVNATTNVGVNPIAIGDQLVASSTAGMAMADNNANAGVIGIALTALASGTGTVSIAVNPVGGQTTPYFRSTSATAFRIQDGTAANTLLNFDSSAATSGILTITGNIIGTNVNGTNGINTGSGSGTQRIDTNGALLNITSLTLSGAISGGTSYSGSGNINTTGGTLQTNSVTRVDNSGNLVAIGNITGTAAVTLASGGSSDLTLDSASNKLQLAASDTDIQRTANTDFNIDLNSSSPRTLFVKNSDATAGAVTNLDVDGGVNIGSSQTYKIGGTPISSSALSNDSNLAKLNANQTFTGTNAFNLSNAAAVKVENNGTRNNTFVVNTSAGPSGSTGSVGINTAPNTSYALDVNGDVNIQNTQFYRYNGTAGITLGSACSSSQALLSSNVQGGIVTAGSCQTVATCTSVFCQNGNTFGALATLGTTDAQDLRLVTGTGGPNERLRITAAGNTTITNGTTGDALTVTNSTSTGNILVLKDNATTVVAIADGGAATFENSVNSAAAFQVQNLSAINLFQVDTSLDAANLITNGSFEVNTTGWAAKNGSGTSTLTQVTTQQYIGTGSMQDANTGASSASAGATWSRSFTNSTVYSFSLFAKASGSNFSTFEIGNSNNNSADTSCLTAQTVVTTGWTKFSCSFTYTGTTGTSFVYFKQTDATNHTMFIDGVKLEAASTATPYREGGISLNGNIGSPATFKNQSDSTTAFQIQNSAGTSNLLVADTLNSKIGVNQVATSTGAAVQITGGLSLAGDGGTAVGTTKTLVNNGSTLFSAKAIANIPGGGSIGTAATTVDVASSFTINQSAGNTTITLPNPTDTTAGRIIYVSNIGSNFSLLGQLIPSGISATMFWSGTAWTFSGANGSAILNQNGTTQTANFNISGTGEADTSLISPILQTASGGTTSSALLLQSGDITGSNSNTSGSITIRTGNAASGNNSSGSISVDTGVLSGSGTAGTISVGTTNASAITIGRSGLASRINGTLGIGAAGATAVLTVGTNTTASTGGIIFGTDTSAELYRSASGVVSVSGSLALGTIGSSSGTTVLCWNGAGTLIQGCATGGGSTNFIVNGVSLQTANYYVQSGASASTPTAVIEKATSQTGDLLRFLDTNGSTVLAKVDVAGGVTGTTVNSSGGASVLKGATSDSTAAALDVQNSTSVSILFARNDLNVGIGDSTPSTQLDVAGTTSSVGVLSTGGGAPTGLAVTTNSGLGVCTYTYEVTSVTDTGESAPSATVNSPILAPNPPNEHLTWNGVRGAISYNVYRTAGSGLGCNNSNGKVTSVTATPELGTTTYAANDTSNTLTGSLPSGTDLSFAVGVGTSTPSQALDVQGAIQANFAAGSTAFALCHTGTNGASNDSNVTDCNGTPADLAEMYATKGDVEPGDVVAIDPGGNNLLIKTNSLNQWGVLGVISTNPTDIMANETISSNRYPQPLSLAGRVPVKVSLENGPILAGDPLVSSSTPGVAMKAVAKGGIIGRAIESYDGSVRVSTEVETQEKNRDIAHPDLAYYRSDPSSWPDDVGKIAMLPSASYYDPASGASTQGGSTFNAVNVEADVHIGQDLFVLGTTTTKDLAVTGTATINDLFVTGTATIGNLTVTGNAILASVKVTGNADFLGDVSVGGNANFAKDLNFTGAAGQSRNAVTKKFIASKDVHIGDVVVADAAHDGQVATTAAAGDTKVLGVALSDTLAGQEALVAIGGSVQVKASAAAVAAGIVNGDVLVSSAEEGKADKATAPASGTIIGKALGKPDPAGLVWILIGLQ